jgi:hypothetical protein
LWVAGGYAAIGVAVAGWFWLNGGLGQLVSANFAWPLNNYSSANSVHYGLGLTEFYWDRWAGTFSAVFGRPTGIVLGSILMVPFLYIAGLPVWLALFVIRYRRAAFDGVSLPYWICGAAIWISEIHRKDIMHLVYGSPLLMILSFYLWRKHQPRFFRPAAQILAACTMLLALLNIGLVLTASTKLVTRRGTVTTFKPDRALEFLMAKASPGEAVFAYPFRPMYYFLAGLTNPTRYSFLMYGYNNAAQFTDAVRAVESSGVRYVVWDEAFDEADGAKWTLPGDWKLRSHRLIMEPYLESRYREVAHYEDLRILRRSDPPIGKEAK